jgi:hypothetical protein
MIIFKTYVIYKYNADLYDKTMPTSNDTLLQKKRIIWKPDHVISLKLKDDLYTLAQMHDDVRMTFFDVASSINTWHDIDLNHKKILFTVAVLSRPLIQELAIAKLSQNDVTPSNAVVPTQWLKPLIVKSGGPFRGGNLVEISALKNNGNPIFIRRLTPEDNDLIKKLELTIMWGAEDIRHRLVHYFTTGADINEIKNAVFAPGWDNIPEENIVLTGFG